MAETARAGREGRYGREVNEVKEQLEFTQFTADSPQGDTVKLERGRPQSGTQVLPRKLRGNRKALFAITMEEIASSNNLRLAFQRVKANKGAAGIDGRTVEEVGKHLDNIVEELHRELLNGEYLPGNIRRAWIPKSGGEKRGLGIPNVVDRIVQQATHQVMSPMYETEFHASSHGFRPGKSCHTAITEAKGYIEEGYEWVVDIDLEKFFDRVNHDRLLSKLERRIGDKRVLTLIRRMLKAKVVMPDGVVVSNEEGTPQGGPLSPLLSNIVLSELDAELSTRGHRFVRYADDCNIYVRSERSGHRVMASIQSFIERRLKLKVNSNKSAVAKPAERHFLGFRLERDPFDGKVSVRLSRRSKERIDGKVREKTPRNWGNSMHQCIEKLNEYLQGWMGFFRICTEEELEILKLLDSHIRRRLRAIQLRHWKRKRFIARKLIRLGVPPKKAWGGIYQGKKSWWALSQCHAVHLGLRNEIFTEQKLYSLVSGWKRWNPRNIVTAPIQLSLELG